MAVEPSEEMMAEARTASDNQQVRFLKAKAEKLPLENQSADLVFISFEITENVWQYLEKIRLKGISVIRMLPEEIFLKGLKKLENFCQVHGNEGPVMDTRDLLVFQKS